MKTLQTKDNQQKRTRQKGEEEKSSSEGLSFMPAPFQLTVDDVNHPTAPNSDPLENRQTKPFNFKERYGNVQAPAQKKVEPFNFTERYGKAEQPVQKKVEPFNFTERYGKVEQPVQKKVEPFNFTERYGKAEQPVQKKVEPFNFTERYGKAEQPVQKKVEPFNFNQHAKENSTKSNGQLPEQVKAKMENTIGHDFSNVNIHKESQQATSAGALAFAQGNDVHFAPGQFKPDTKSGQELIGHELTHVAQQRDGRVQATTQAKGLPVNDDPVLEKEADDLGKKAAVSSGASAESPPVAGTLLQGKGIVQKSDGDYIGIRVNYKGRVRAESGIILHASPSPDDAAYQNRRGNEDFIYEPSSQVTVIAESNAENQGWLLIIAQDGAVGWIEGHFIRRAVPSELDAITKKFYTVKSGDTVEGLIRRFYPDYPYETGNDRRAISETIYRLNESEADSAVYLVEDDAGFTESLRDTADPFLAEQRRIYRTVQIRAGGELRLPTASYIEMLRTTGAIGTRPEWMNDAVEVGRSVQGFVVGLGDGFVSQAWDTLTGLWDLLKSIFTGEIIEQAQQLYNQFSELGVSGVLGLLVDLGVGFANDFMAAWNSGNPFQRWHFIGKVVGAIIFEIVLAWATAGIGTAIRGTSFFQKFSRHFSNLAEFIAKKTGNLRNPVTSQIDEIIAAARRRQRQIIGDVESGNVDLEVPGKPTNHRRRGNYGEMKMDDHFESNGYEKLGDDRIIDIDQPITQGIDGVFVDLGPPRKFVIAEAKYNTSQLGKTRDGPQMSDDWIENRLEPAVGAELADEILAEGYERVLLRVDVNGNITTEAIDAAGAVTGNWP